MVFKKCLMVSEDPRRRAADAHQAGKGYVKISKDTTVVDQQLSHQEWGV